MTCAAPGICVPRAPALEQLHDDPDRLRVPLVRRDGRLVEVGWDEAFAEVDRRLLGGSLAEPAGSRSPSISAIPTSTTSPASST